MIEIINFEPRYIEYFRQLNMEWLQLYNLLEAHDVQLLENPQQHIIDPGGCIFLAREHETIVGCAGLMKEDNEVFELVKMSVSPASRGKGISKILLQRCIEEARKLHAKKITLLSNHQLQKALRLYRQFGFTDIPIDHSAYETADVKMELLLGD